jgi:hypothetical protein
VFSPPHDGGAHGAPARERRGAWGPRKRPSRGVGRSPTLESGQTTVWGVDTPLSRPAIGP